MTVTEFFRNKGQQMCIHCDDINKALKLLECFDRLGEKWRYSNYRYTEDDSWGVYRENTCYTNDNQFSEFEYFAKEGWLILEFEEMELI